MNDHIYNLGKDKSWIKQLLFIITFLLPSTENTIVVQRPLILFERLFVLIQKMLTRFAVKP